jgi:hypothetical protein
MSAGALHRNKVRKVDWRIEKPVKHEAETTMKHDTSAAHLEVNAESKET